MPLTATVVGMRPAALDFEMARIKRDTFVSMVHSRRACARKYRAMLIQVDMATYGQTSWALTSLGAWRHKSLATGNSPEFVRNRQREARRAFLRAGISTTGGSTGVAPRGREPTQPPGGSGSGEMAVDEA